jgi:hypothetical protein
MSEDRQLNIEMALFMGWTRWTILSADCPSLPGVTYFADWGIGESGLAVYLPEDDGDVSFHFNPVRDISDAFTVEERIKELGLQEKYIEALIFQLPKVNSDRYWIGRSFDADELFAIAHASAKERVRAALAAFKEGEI